MKIKTKICQSSPLFVPSHEAKPYIVIALIEDTPAVFWVYLFTGPDYRTGTLEWTTGLTYFWFLHVLWLAKLILVG